MAVLALLVESLSQLTVPLLSADSQVALLYPAMYGVLPSDLVLAVLRHQPPNQQRLLKASCGLTHISSFLAFTQITMLAAKRQQSQQELMPTQPA
jgi:hypothetical protein